MACKAELPAVVEGTVVDDVEEEEERAGEAVVLRCDCSILRTMVTGGWGGLTLCWPVAIRRWTAARRLSVVKWRSIKWVMREKRLRGMLSQSPGPGPHWQ